MKTVQRGVLGNIIPREPHGGVLNKGGCLPVLLLSAPKPVVPLDEERSVVILLLFSECVHFFLDLRPSRQLLLKLLNSLLARFKSNWAITCLIRR